MSHQRARIIEAIFQMNPDWEALILKEILPLPQALLDMFRIVHKANAILRYRSYLILNGLYFCQLHFDP